MAQQFQREAQQAHAQAQDAQASIGQMPNVESMLHGMQNALEKHQRYGRVISQLGKDTRNLRRNVRDTSQSTQQQLEQVEQDQAAVRQIQDRNQEQLLKCVKRGLRLQARAANALGEVRKVQHQLSAAELRFHNEVAAKQRQLTQQMKPKLRGLQAASAKLRQRADNGEAKQTAAALRAALVRFYSHAQEGKGDDAAAASLEQYRGHEPALVAQLEKAHAADPAAMRLLLQDFCIIEEYR